MRKALAWTLGGALAAGAGYKIFRESWIVPGVQGAADPCAQGDANLYYRFLPGCREKGTRADRNVEFSFNGLGLRAVEPRPAAEGTRRVLVIGPSALVAPGLSEDAVPTRVAEAALRRRGLRAEVINAGVMGYNVIQSSLLVKRNLEAYKPQLVVYFLTLEWAAEGANLRERYWNRGHAGEGGSYFPDASTRLPAGMAPRLYGSGLNRWLTTTDLFFRRLRSSWAFLFSSEEARERKSLAVTIEALRFMERECAARGIPFVVAAQDGEEFRNAMNLTNELVPAVAWAFDFLTPRNRIPAGNVRAHLERSGLTVRGTSMVLVRGAEGLEKFRLPDDIHLNEKGAAQLGEDLSYIIEKALSSVALTSRNK